MRASSRTPVWSLPLLVAIVLAVALASMATLVPGCGGGRHFDGMKPGQQPLVLMTFKLPGGPDGWPRIVEDFRKENPDIHLVTEMLPANSDQQHQFYVSNLEERPADFDVFALDTVWGQEFARAGWLQDVTELLGPEYMESLRLEYFSGAMEPCFWKGRCYSLPWFMDAGLLYYRKDLLDKHGLEPPRTFPELEEQVQKIRALENRPDMAGLLWQAKQYEGLICSSLEFIRGNGGKILDRGRAQLDSAACREALLFMRGLLTKGISPAMVTSADEEATRRMFGDGKALFLRNWPYCWGLLNAEGSAVKGKVGIALMPSFQGGESSPTLGGWQIGINPNSKRKDAALKLIRYMCRIDTQEKMVLNTGLTPGRRRLYERIRLLRKNPFLVMLVESLSRAVPRPLTPSYLMLSQVLQSEIYGIVSGVKPPEAALRNAQRQLDRILEVEKTSE